MFLRKEQWGISHWLGSGLGSEISEPSLSWAWPEPLVWTKFGSDFECRLGISDPSCMVFTLVAQLGLGSGSEPSPELSQCEMPHYVFWTGLDVSVCVESKCQSKCIFVTRWCVLDWNFGPKSGFSESRGRARQFQNTIKRIKKLLTYVN